MKKKRVLIANRGEIAVRIIKACQALDIETVLTVSEDDKESMGAHLADKVVCIGPPEAQLSYLNTPVIIDAALANNVDALHPGYGFLAENPGLAELCEKNGIIFIGPRSQVMRKLGDKISARKIAKKSNVPVNDGSEGLCNFRDVEAKAREIGFPLLFKASAGGGGKGMRIVMDPKDLNTSFNVASMEAENAFGDPTLFVERYIRNARHVEAQIIGDNFGKVIHLGLRDCTSQRHYQKIVEESPPHDLPADLGKRITEKAVKLAEAIGYNSAGTVEFLVDNDRNQFYFMEVNTRIQVEHPVTEMVTGIDIIQEQIRVAFHQPLSVSQSDIQFKDHAIECRITAEDPKDDFFPSPGLISRFSAPNGDNIRIDTHCYEGYVIGPYYDSLLAKLIVKGDTRDAALASMKTTLAAFEISGIETNIPFLRFLINHPDFIRGNINIKWIENSVLPQFLDR
jgi:acetyl-CoA carboxylase biotin carboxylase subunit